MWISGGFPVFKFEFDENHILTNISAEKNLFAKYSSFILFIPIISLIVFSFININFSITGLILPLLFIFVLIVLYFVTSHIYNYEKKQLLIELYNRLDIEFEKEKTKEFTIQKLFTRIIMYPLCILLIAVCLFIIRDAPIPALIGIILPSIYIITDIMILFKRNKK